MTLEQLQEVFETYNGEYMKDDTLTHRLHERADLNAFLLLDALVPGVSDIVSGADHDEIYISVDVEELAAVITEDQIRDLIRCGVLYNVGEECLWMFV